MNLWPTARLVLYTLLVIGVWRETGPFTGIFCALSLIAGEIVAWALGDLMHEEARVKSDEWRRKREARRK